MMMFIIGFVVAWFLLGIFFYTRDGSGGWSIWETSWDTILMMLPGPGCWMRRDIESMSRRDRKKTGNKKAVIDRFFLTRALPYRSEGSECKHRLFWEYRLQRPLLF